MNTDQKSLTYITNLEQSSDLAYRLAKVVQAPQLIELVGDLGGGKTAFVKVLGKALGIKKTIVSPTFTIHQSYEIPDGGNLEHFDLYRLSDDEIVGNELKDALNSNGAIVCVEWAKNFHSALSEDRLTIEFEYISDHKRKLTLTCAGPKSQKLLGALQ